MSWKTGAEPGAVVATGDVVPTGPVVAVEPVGAVEPGDVVVGPTGRVPVVRTSITVEQAARSTAVARARIAPRRPRLPWLPPERPSLLMVVATIRACVADPTGRRGRRRW